MEQPIPLGPSQESGYDELSGASPIALNVLMDSKGTLRRRPGIVASSLATETVGSKPIIGIHRTVGGAIYAVEETAPRYKVWKVRPGGARFLGEDPARVTGKRRPVFAETDALLVIAAGHEVQKVVLKDDTCERLAGSPPKATHVAALNSRLIVNNVEFPTTVNYSDITSGEDYAKHESWTWGVGLAGFFVPEARPDPVVAVVDHAGELLVFGTQTVQTYVPDPSMTWSTVGTIEHGCLAPYSIVKSDGEIYWLDDKRRIVKGQGRAAESISVGIQATLDDMVSVDDCFGYRVRGGRHDCLVWSFPKGGRTFAFQTGIGWGQWTGPTSGIPVTSSHGTGPTGLVGMSDGKVGRFSESVQADFGVPFEAYLETGFINRGTEARKWCRGVRFVVKRSAATTDSQWLLVSWRDDLGAWGEPLRINLDRQAGAMDEVVIDSARSLGIYRRRQWRFEFSGTAELVLVSVMETFDVMEH